MSRAPALAVRVGKQETPAANLEICRMLGSPHTVFACLLAWLAQHTDTHDCRWGKRCGMLKVQKPANSKLKVFDSGVESGSNGAFVFWSRCDIKSEARWTM